MAVDFLRKTVPKLYEDAHVIVFDKPAGLLVIPTPQREDYTLVNIVNAQYAQDQDWRLPPCHRLDRETSGAIIFAKGKSVQRRLMDLFKRRVIKIRYCNG